MTTKSTAMNKGRINPAITFRNNTPMASRIPNRTKNDTIRDMVNAPFSVASEPDWRILKPMTTSTGSNSQIPARILAAHPVYSLCPSFVLSKWRIAGRTG